MTSLINVSQLQRGISLIELNRPEARNALSIAMLDALDQAIRRLGNAPGERVLILKGAGPIFCAGLDLKEASNRDRSHQMAQRVASALKTLYLCPLVTIAAIQGVAIAGGAGIVSACDLVIASEETKIGYPETRRGLVAAMVMTLLRRQIGDRHVRELLFTGELISADHAKQIGLINHVVSAPLLLEEAIKMAQNILKGAPGATNLTKTLLEELQETHLENDIDRALAFHNQARSSLEADEGILAFSEKREPCWN